MLTSNGEGFYPGSPSEFVRFSLAARTHVKPDCGVDVKPNVRPPLPEPVVADGGAALAEELLLQPPPAEPAPPVEQPAQPANQEAAAAVSAELPAGVATV